MAADILAQILGIDSLRSVSQAFVDGIVLGSSYAMVGAAFALILGVTTRFHFAFAICYTAAAYLTAVSVERGIPLVFAGLIGLSASIVLACTIEVAAYRPIAARAGGNTLLGIFVAGMGIGIAGENVIRLIWGNNAKIISGAPSKSIHIGDVSLTAIELAQVIVAAAILVALTLVLDRSLFGQRIKAVRVNPDMAEAVGVDVSSTYLAVFGVGTLIAGIAALFESLRFSAVPDMGNTPVFYAFVVAFVAGVHRSPISVGLVGLGFGLVASLSTLWVSENLTSLVVFGLLCIWLTARVFPTAVRQLSGAFSGRGSAPATAAAPTHKVGI